MRLTLQRKDVPVYDTRFPNALTILLILLLNCVVGFGTVRVLSTPFTVPNLAINSAPVLAVIAVLWIHVMSATQHFSESPPVLQISRYSPLVLVLTALICVPLALLVIFTTSRLGSTDSAIALITVSGCAGIILLTIRKINWGPCSLLLLLPLGLILHAAIRSNQLATDELGYIIWNPEMLLLLAAGLGVFLHSLRSKEGLVLSWLTPILLFFLFWTVLSAALSADPQYSMRVVIAGTLMPILAYYLFINAIKSRDDFKRTVHVFVTSFFLLGAYSLVRTVQLSQGQDILSGDIRVSPLVMNPADVGGVLLLGLSLTAGIILARSNSLQMRVALSIGFTILAFALMMTFTRGSWMAGAISLLILLALNTRFQKLVLLSLPAILFIFALAKDLIVQLALARTISLDVFLQSNPWLGRVAAWDSAANMISANPLVGIGPGLYREYYREFETASYFWAAMADAHSLPLELASNSGIVAAVAFLAVIGIVLWMAYRVYRSSEDDFMRYSALGLFLALIAFLVYSSTSGSQLASVTRDRLYFFGGHTYYLFMFFGLVSALYRLSKQDEIAKKENHPERPMVVSSGDDMRGDSPRSLKR